MSEGQIFSVRINTHLCWTCVSPEGRLIIRKVPAAADNQEPATLTQKDSDWSLDCAKDVFAVTQRGASVTSLILKCALWDPKTEKLKIIEHRVECTSSKQATDFKDAVLHAAYPEGPKNIYIFVNPVSGAGRAVKVWNDVAEPILSATIHNVTVTTTKYAHHAEELMSDLRVHPSDIVVAVSGDGLLNEILNGLRKRPDWTPRMCKLGTIPSGSGNALAKAMGYMHPTQATIAVAKGVTTPLDIIRLQQGTDVRYGAIGLGYAISADVDINSEPWRWMGGARFTAYAVKKLMAPRLQGYEATLKFVACNMRPHSHCTMRPNCPTCAEALANPSLAPPPDADTEPERWTTIQGDFLYINANSIPYIAKDFKTTPMSHAADGLIDLIFMMRKDVGRIDMAKLMIEMETGGHVTHPKVQYVKCTKVIFTPGPKNLTHTVIDGEIIPTAHTEVSTEAAGLSFVVAGWDH
eukprot:PhM_4_TR14755/c0_g11_i1/m.70161/K04718/SPHK; sphingosine kinase